MCTLLGGCGSGFPLDYCLLPFPTPACSFAGAARSAAPCTGLPLSTGKRIWHYGSSIFNLFPMGSRELKLWVFIGDGIRYPRKICSIIEALVSVIMGI